MDDRECGTNSALLPPHKSRLVDFLDSIVEGKRIERNGKQRDAAQLHSDKEEEVTEEKQQKHSVPRLPFHSAQWKKTKDGIRTSARNGSILAVFIDID